MKSQLNTLANRERERIAQILDLPAAKIDRAGAEALAFRSDATPDEAARALARAADRKAEAREMSAESMRLQCSLPPKNPKPLTAGQRSMAKALASSGNPAERKAARAKLTETR